MLHCCKRVGCNYCCLPPDIQLSSCALKAQRSGGSGIRGFHTNKNRKTGSWVVAVQNVTLSRLFRRTATKWRKSGLYTSTSIRCCFVAHIQQYDIYLPRATTCFVYAWLPGRGSGCHTASVPQIKSGIQMSSIQEEKDRDERAYSYSSQQSVPP